MKYKTEEELATDVKEWLLDQGWDVYSEVEIVGGRADLVATRGGIVWIIEAKLSFTLALIEQAYRWRSVATLVSVAVPKTKKRNSGGRQFAEGICRQEGIGIIYVGPTLHSHWGTVAPRWNRKAGTNRVLDTLCEAHKNYSAGNAENKYYTPFRATCDRIKDHLRNNPGSTMKEIVNAIDHHYASDRSANGALLHWIREGIIDWIETDKSSKPHKFYLK